MKWKEIYLLYNGLHVVFVVPFLCSDIDAHSRSYKVEQTWELIMHDVLTIISKQRKTATFLLTKWQVKLAKLEKKNSKKQKPRTIANISAEYQEIISFTEKGGLGGCKEPFGS